MYFPGVKLNNIKITKVGSILDEYPIFNVFYLTKAVLIFIIANSTLQYIEYHLVLLIKKLFFETT